MDEGRPSVRVEVSEIDAAPLAPPVPQEPGSNRTKGLFAGVAAIVALVGLVAVLAFLQPETGETAVGDIRASTTIAPSTTTGPTTAAPTTIVAPTTTSAPSVDSGLPIGSYPDSIVRANDGFLMLLSGGDGRSGLWRSVDGSSWTANKFTVADVAVDGQPTVPTSWTNYTGLIDTPNGFAMLELREEGGGAQSVSRLTSTDGLFWKRSPALLTPSEGGWAYPFVHSPEVVLMQKYFGTGGDEITELLRAVLRPDVAHELADICHVAGMGNFIELFDCNSFGEPNRVERGDLIDPEVFDDVVACVRSISESGYEDLEFWSIDVQSGERSKLESGLLLWQGVAMPETATVVAVDLEQPIPDVSPRCDGLIDLMQQEEDLPTAVVLVEPDGSTRRIDMPISVEAQELWENDWAPPVVSSGPNGSFYLAAEGKVWKLDLERLAWQDILSLPTDDMLPRFSRDGGVVVVATEQGFDVGDLATREWRTVIVDDARDSWPIYVDDEVAILVAGGSRIEPVVVSLTAD